MRFLRSALATLTAIVLVSAAGAHELTDNRATLVLRDRTHLSMTLYLRYTEAVHKALAPQAGYGEFLVAVSALGAADFEKQMQRAHQTLQSGMRITLNERQAAGFSNWAWPDPGKTQRLFQQQVMEATLGGHHHEEPVEVRADVISTTEIRTASVEFGRALGKVLLVWYRPQQSWMDPGQKSPPLRFH
jgi:hypothetical protein